MRVQGVLEPPAQYPAYICDDCGCETRWLNAALIAAGSQNRDPGEKICAGCSASRTVLITRLNLLPDTLHQIQAMRMTRP